MGKTFLEKILGPIFRANLVIQILFAAVLTYLNVKLGVGAFIVIIAMWLYYKKYSENKSSELKEYTDTITEEMDDSAKQFIAENPLPICMIDKEGAVLWVNHKFRSLFADVELFNTNILEIAGTKEAEFLPEDEIFTLRQVYYLIMLGACFVVLIYTFLTYDDYFYLTFFDVVLSLFIAITYEKTSLKNKIILIVFFEISMGKII